MTLGNWLKQYREQHQISQPQLANDIGIEQSYLSILENDKKDDLKQVSRKLVWFGILMSLGVFFYYLGNNAVFFSNMAYRYDSFGVLKENEPLEAFIIGKHGKNDKIMTKEQYQRRLDPKSITLNNNRVRSFVSSENNERRYYVQYSKAKVKLPAIICWKPVVCCYSVVV